MSEKVIIGLTLKEAVDMLSTLESHPEDSLFVRLVSDIKRQVEHISAEREIERQETEKRRIFDAKRKKEAVAACGREGHPSLEPGGLVDTMTVPGKYVYVRGCSRCLESMVVLADGKLMGWIPWTDTKPLPPLAEEMFTDLPREKEGEFEAPFTDTATPSAPAPSSQAGGTPVHDEPVQGEPVTPAQGQLALFGSEHASQ